MSLAVLRWRHPASRFDNRETGRGVGGEAQRGWGAAGNHYKWPVIETCTAPLIRIVRARLARHKQSVIRTFGPHSSFSGTCWCFSVLLNVINVYHTTQKRSPYVPVS